MDHWELYFENLKKAKIDVSEFLVQCRVKGYFDVSKLETAILEGNGKIIFLPKVAERPITPFDVNISLQQDYMVANVILATCDSSNQVTVFLKSNRRGAKSVHM
ncbi:MAG: YetF domain-containing protein [Lachnoclostridium sp.]